MNISRTVARVYAQALLDLAIQNDNVGEIGDDLAAVSMLFEEDRTFREFFASPRLDPEAKKKVLQEALSSLVRPVLGLLCVLVDKQRELVLDNIMDEFERFRDLREGRLHADVTSAQPLDSEQLADITSRLEKATGKKVLIHEKRDPGVLGGLIVKVGDKVIDGSLRRRLDRLRRSLVSIQE